MRSKVTIFALLLALTLSVFIAPSTSNAQAPVKRALLEEFTGSWCGWCPRGIYGIQLMEAKYPGQFIPVAFHNADPMVFPACDTMETSITGYPDAWLDRVAFNTTNLDTDPTTWDAQMTQIMAAPVAADVAVSNVTYDPVTRMLSAKVTAKFAIETVGDLRFNMYIIEDSVSGPAGSAYDQTNYLTNRAGYEVNPFFNLPAKVPSYQHMHVCRAVLGGVPGVAGIIPAQAAVGSTYSATFTTILPPYVKAQNASVVGFVFNDDPNDISNRQVVNADMKRVTNITKINSTSKLTATTSKQYITAARNGQTTQTITFSNAGTADVVAHVVVDNGTSTMPAGWSAIVAPSDVTVPAKGTATATLTFNAPAKAAFAIGTVGYWPAVAGELSVGTEISVGALSANTKYASFGGDGTVIKGMPAKYSDDFVALPLSAAIFSAYPVKDFEVGIFPNIAYLDYANLNGVPVPAVVPSINAMLTANKKVFITSTFGLFYCFDKTAPYYSAMNTAAVKTLFNTKLGIKFIALTARTVSNNPTTTNVTGFTGDVIGNGINFSAYYYQSDLFSITNTANTKPVLFLDDDQTTLGGFRYDNGTGQRLVYLNLNFGLVPDQTSANTLVAKSMEFLLNGENDVKTVNTTASALSVSANPFQGSTVINYNALPTEHNVTFSVVDMLGREVANLTPSAFGNTYSVNFDASDLANGAYVIIAHSSEGTHQIRVVNAQ